MSKEFLEVGDQLVVKVAGMPVAYAIIEEFNNDGTATVVFDRRRTSVVLATFDYEEA